MNSPIHSRKPLFGSRRGNTPSSVKSSGGEGEVAQMNAHAHRYTCNHRESKTKKSVTRKHKGYRASVDVCVCVYIQKRKSRSSKASSEALNHLRFEREEGGERKERGKAMGTRTTRPRQWRREEGPQAPRGTAVVRSVGGCTTRCLSLTLTLSLSLSFQARRSMRTKEQLSKPMPSSLSAGAMHWASTPAAAVSSRGSMPSVA